MRRILCLHLPYLATERARRIAAAAEHKELPLALARPAGAALIVECVCPRARAGGVTPGMTAGQAQALAPGLVVVPYDPVADAAQLEALASWALRLSPSVEPVPPGALLVDITGCQRLFGGEEQIAQQARAGLLQQGHQARAAIADTIGAAWALAHGGDDECVLVPPGQTSVYLAPLLPGTLRIDQRTQQRLDAVGLRTIGDLLTLPWSLLPARFGPELVRRLQQALGEVPESLAPHVPPDVPRVGRRFAGPVSDVAAVQAVGGELLAALLDGLQQRGAAPRELECGLYFEQTPPLVLRIGLARATRQVAHLRQLVEQWLERVDLGPGVIALTLTAVQTSRWNGRQGDLFEVRPPSDEEALGSLVDRLASRLGQRTIVRPRLLDDHQPETAYRWVSVAEAGLDAPRVPTSAEDELSSPVRVAHGLGCGKTQDSLATHPASGGMGHPPSAPFEALGHMERSSPRTRATALERCDASRESPADTAVAQGVVAASAPVRPAQLFARPLAIRVTALEPDGPPAWFAWRDVEYPIAHATGPERIETAWWRGPDVRRDYYRVTVASGAQLWIFRARDGQRWYLHGIFA